MNAGVNTERGGDVAALRHLEQAERDSAEHPSLAGVVPRAVQRVAVIGAGTMGSGIAIAALEAGLDLLLLEQDAVALDRGRARIDEHFARRVQAGKVTPEVAQDRHSRVRTSRFLNESDLSESRLATIEALNEVARGRGQSLAQLALAWALRDPRVTSLIIGASAVAQLEQNLGALSAPALSADELDRIDAVLAGQ